ncbi:uncharacterized protein LOC113306311 [Papaver somniferum]|uniref:uncharacterized protein LOC113306311 n=1 Tax=Papaver somniferum TaxID=3469 RepID=UPI000E704A1C|nr:uncharacterized protein LOC113306311 [Papaver somniferum]
MGSTNVTIDDLKEFHHDDSLAELPLLQTTKKVKEVPESMEVVPTVTDPDVSSDEDKIPTRGIPIECATPRYLWIQRNHDDDNIFVDLAVYSDTDWAGCVEDTKSTSGGFYYVGLNLVAWYSKRQNSQSLSTCEAEYIAAGL